MIQGETLGLSESIRDSVVERSTNMYRAVGRRFLQRGTSELRSSLRISCFSETYLSVPMWAHYAGNHSGICIEWCPLTWSKAEPRLRHFYPVIYDEHPFQVPSLAFSPHNQGADILLALRKSIDWSYEKEWRYVVRSAASNSGHLEPLPFPCAVHAGLLMKAEDQSRLRELCDELKLDFHRVGCDQELGCLTSIKA